MYLVSSTEPVSIASTSKECSCHFLTVDTSKMNTSVTLKDSKPNDPKKILKNKNDNQTSDSDWRRPCGCLKTSDKLKALLEQFPAPPPPPSPSLVSGCGAGLQNTSCISAFCVNDHEPFKPTFEDEFKLKEKYVNELELPKKSITAKSWRLVSEIGQIIQLSVTATALAFYYIIYCYMQLIYFTLRSAMFFHNADGPMKLTIAVVTATSLVVGFNLILRMERLIGISVAE